MKLANKVAIITGGGTGIGKATAFLFAEEGASVVITGRRENVLREAAAEAGKNGISIDYHLNDVTKPDECRQVTDYVIKKYGKIDILFNNAGYIYSSEAHEIPVDVWQHTFDVNVRGTFLMSKNVIPHMLARSYGIIINNSSILGLKASRNFAAYNSSKGAVNQLTRSMALEYAKNGIRVNALCPGTVYTPLVDDMFEQLGEREAVEQRYISVHPIGRLCQPEEMAHAVLYLCDDNIGFMTGAMVSVDGGLSAK